MSKGLRTGLMIILALFLILCGVRVVTVKLPYWKSQQTYHRTSGQYTAPQRPDSVKTEKAEKEPETTAGNTEDAGDPKRADHAPISVDFDALRKVNEDVVAWIYCEGTLIDYPVLHGETNDTYLYTLYTGEYNPSGSIFSDCSNAKGVVDSNIILYGHHMLDGSMFASLKNWFDQGYYDAHPVMWYLTPEQDYRVDLFAGYSTTADSWVYTIYQGPSIQFDSYLQVVRNSSVFTTDVELDGNAHYLLLSTCAYNGDEYGDFRTVLHGKLVPVD